MTVTAPLKEKKKRICIAPYCEKLASEALGLGSTVCTLQLHHTWLYLVKNSPDGATTDGATTDRNNSRLIAYNSFIDPERMKSELI